MLIHSTFVIMNASKLSMLMTSLDTLQIKTRQYVLMISAKHIRDRPFLAETVIFLYDIIYEYMRVDRKTSSLLSEL